LVAIEHRRVLRRRSMRGFLPGSANAHADGKSSLGKININGTALQKSTAQRELEHLVHVTILS